MQSISGRGVKYCPAPDFLSAAFFSLFHAVRRAGNSAAHEIKGTHADALEALKFARQLGVWFHRTYGRQPRFKAGPFVPPPEPADATATLREEIETPPCRSPGRAASPGRSSGRRGCGC
jgi:hypothetical protein